MQAPIDNPATRLEAVLRRCAQLASAVVVPVGVLILTGWTRLIVIEGIVPWFRMPPISALLFVLSGIGLWCSAVQQQTPALLVVSRVCAMLVIVAASLNLVEYLSGLNFGFDTFGFSDISGPVSVSARMPYLSALNFLGIGSALLVAGNARRIILFQTLVLLVGLNGALGMSRNVFGGESLLPFQFMAHASTCAVILGAGLFCLRPRGGLVDIVMGDRMRVKLSMPFAYGLAVGLTGITLLARPALNRQSELYNE